MNFTCMINVSDFATVDEVVAAANAVDGVGVDQHRLPEGYSILEGATAAAVGQAVDIVHASVAKRSAAS